jgi:hypothetical protein
MTLPTKTSPIALAKKCNAASVCRRCTSDVVRTTCIAYRWYQAAAFDKYFQTYAPLCFDCLIEPVPQLGQLIDTSNTGDEFKG